MIPQRAGSAKLHISEAVRRISRGDSRPQADGKAMHADAVGNERVRQHFELQPGLSEGFEIPRVGKEGKHPVARAGLVNDDLNPAANSGKHHDKAWSVEATDSEAVAGPALFEAATDAGYNIRVNCVVTVLTQTTLTASLTQNELTLKASVALHPLGHIGEPAEVGSAIRWFMSPEQS